MKKKSSKSPLRLPLKTRLALMKKISKDIESFQDDVQYYRFIMADARKSVRYLEKRIERERESLRFHEEFILGGKQNENHK